MSSLRQANGILTARSQVWITECFTYPGSLSFTDLSPIWPAVGWGGVVVVGGCTWYVLQEKQRVKAFCKFGQPEVVKMCPSVNQESCFADTHHGFKYGIL